MRAASIFLFAFVFAVAALLAVYVPLEVVKGVSARTLDPIFGGVVVVVSIVAGGGLLFFLVVFVFAGRFLGSEETPLEYRLRLKEVEERLTLYRARQRAMLEELDEIKKLLEEIRVILKEGMGV